jgi:hypothetical protein
MVAGLEVFDLRRGRELAVAFDGLRNALQARLSSGGNEDDVFG